MADQKAMVRDASNQTQVKAAIRTAQDIRDDELRDLGRVLRTREGRNVLDRIIGWCGVHRSIFDANGSRLYYNAGRQDVGHFVLSEVTAADPKATLLMMQEAGRIEAEKIEPAPPVEAEI